MKSFFRFFAERHILATLITLMIVLLGLSTLMHIKRDSYPEVSYGVMIISTRYPGASPEDVELNVTNKIEDELKSVAGIEKITSFSMENISFVRVQIDINESDQEKIKTEIREAVNKVTDFPKEVTESPQVTEIKISLVPIIEVGLTGDVPYKELREHARIFEKKLKVLPGVSRIDRFGYRTREIKVEVSPRAIEQYQIPMREIITAIQSRNIRGTTGSFESYTSEKDIVTLAQFRRPVEVGNVIVRSTFDGPQVKVKDLAIIKDEFQDERVLSRVNGKSAISLVVYKSESADVIRTCDRIKSLVEKESKILPEKVKLLYANDFDRYVKNRFNVVLSNGLIGFILLLLVLPIFLNFRLSFWVAMGIPIALLGTIFMLPLFDVYLDSLTLMGIILVIGIIVDDAIIIGENIASHRERGKSPIDAAVDGIHEVFSPVITTILTTFLVFAPMFFMSGMMGKFVFVIPLSISLALFISLGEAVVALPAHIAHGMGKHSPKKEGKHWFHVFSEAYRRVMKHVLKLRYVLVIIFAALLLTSFWYAANYMKFMLMPSDMADRFYVYAKLPTGTSLKTTSEKVKEVEQLINDLPKDEKASFVTRVGLQILDGFISMESESGAQLTVDLTPYAERSRTADQIVDELRKKTDKLEGFKEINYLIESGGPPLGRDVILRFAGSDDAMRKQLADSVESYLSSIKGVKDITRDDTPGKDQVEIKINYSKLSRLGLTVADIAQNVRIAYDGDVVTSVRYGDEDVDFRVMLQERARKRLNYLRDLQIPNRQGRLIPLKEVAWLKTGPGPSDYRHFDGDRTVMVEANVDKEVITPVEVTNAVINHFDLDKDWPGMRFIVGGEAMETGKSMESLMRTMLIAIIGIYFLLVLLFNSLTQPFLVMAAIPFGVTGVIAAFAFHGEPFGFFSVLGIIGLSGVVVNDSLVLVSHINTLKKSRPKASIKEIVADGTADRLRAIVMTTITTVVALLPLAYGLGGTDPWMAPLALALGWGLLFASPLTLVLVPCFYVIGQDVHGIFSRKK